MDAVDFLAPWVDLATTRAYLRGMSEHDPKEPPDTIIIEIGPHLVDMSTIMAVTWRPVRHVDLAGTVLPADVSVAIGKTPHATTLSIAYPNDEAAKAAFQMLRDAWLSRPGVQHIHVD